jgi:hypothetical protein
MPYNDPAMMTALKESLSMCAFHESFKRAAYIKGAENAAIRGDWHREQAQTLCAQSCESRIQYCGSQMMIVLENGARA